MLPTIVLLSLVDRLNFDVVISLGIHVSEVTVGGHGLPAHLSGVAHHPHLVLRILMKFLYDLDLFQI